ncbi:hypothetical protein H6G33_18080 [Calothrix sp. FACHB-1219]|uniref:hypothetical protein n=1 Tax=unclassified Calothrix TaxID=2619626 RepID=UPI001689CA34|nr:MULTISPECIES: hypothetical protein [unclassified Calothrix]MBD2202787.1 hypothetical protein [Calothrix sp. FACHB-168]MBD2218940.1 hypothetical protein [Calothrix sp. FACHB-1219]
MPIFPFGKSCGLVLLLRLSFLPFLFTVKVPKDNYHSSEEFIDKECEFIDGGVGTYNNSSLRLFLEAVQTDYGTAWPSGADKLLLVSIGTGYSYADIEFGEAKKKNNAQWAGYVANDLMYEANLQQNQLVKLISKQISMNNSKLTKDRDSYKIVPENQELMTYCRFTTSMTVERFKSLTEAQKLQLKDENGNPIPADAITNDLVNKLEKMDCVDQMDNLSAIGQAIANEQFDIKLFQGFLEQNSTQPQPSVSLN